MFRQIGHDERVHKQKSDGNKEMGNDLEDVSCLSFGDESTLLKESQWNAGRDQIVEGIRSLVANFPPRGSTYTPSELEEFIQIASFAQLARRAHGFVEEKVQTKKPFAVNAFPSIKSIVYTVFYKFYTDPARLPSRSDAFDIIISSVTPYVDAIFTENHQAESLRKAQRRDDFISHLAIRTMRDLRNPSAPSVRHRLMRDRTAPFDG